ncbi:MAG: Thioredoxin reductase [uncultured Pyrinomonadaceae bacterium]|uniref:Thioredoxin reductase n=1 Tax=uncultured Pyrinomonadaceae bacterium TaxID=2283094 RepID=A0A6J4NY91_9BACT|nr:MAG: Thioredoxin reductase [uncultured Pyrinomonadaceae bacterium]
MNYDVIIIGGGAAGLSAALWCAELKLKTLLLERGAELGGQLLRVYNPIKNHLGIETENGREMRDVFLRQLENYAFTVRLRSEIEQIDLSDKSVILAGGETFRARAIIIATGVRRRKLDVEGEGKFQGKGIIESGTRDADSVKNKNVCVVGGGDAALENALILSETARRVTLVHRRNDFRARDEFVARVKKNPKVEIFNETVVRGIFGDQRVETIELENLKTRRKIEKNVEAILIRIGVEPNTDFFGEKPDLDERGYIKITQNCETNIETVYAVGDAANPIAPTVSSAVGMGATAAKAIFARLNS